MTRVKAQRGSLLSSIVMVMLATVATGMLAFIGFQALPDSVIPATFGGDDRSSRHVNVSEAPAPTQEPKRIDVVPSTKPPFPSATANPQATSRPTHDPKPEKTTSTVTRTTDPRPNPVTTTTKPPAPKPGTTTTAPPKVTPSPTQSTQTASPAPTCGTGRKPRCPRSAEPAASTSPARTSSYGTSGYSDTSYETPSKSSTGAKSKPAKKTAGKAAKKTAKR